MVDTALLQCYSIGAGQHSRGNYTMTVRKVTNQIYAALEEGALTHQQVAEAALAYMSEDEVADMAHSNEFFLNEEDEEEWSAYTADYNDRGSHHHW